VPCPHFSTDAGECLLQEDTEDEEDRGEVVLDDAVRRDLCLSSDRAYANCPVFRRYLGDLLP
jgi:hypothetical protein